MFRGQLFTRHNLHKCICRVESFKRGLGHFALNDPSYSPYDVISDVIGNPHYSAFYPYVIVDLRGTRVGARVTARGLGLP